ncbi:hypothetical protein [Vibrio sp. CUB2]|uniref:hypothetical protein n=1 Tax=Vibrio sp. CUB2 TaxID=2315233 RepID=UPI000A485EE6|nr:hypothetical protein [Vibrio sp. CUB2]
MNPKTLLLVTTSLLSLSAHSANDVYGTVDEIFLRSGNTGDNYIAFRINVMKDISYFENCVIDSDNLVWKVDQSSPVSQYQYGIIKDSYKNQLPIRIIGTDGVCNQGNVYSDKVYEISPWSWGYHLSNREISE